MFGSTVLEVVIGLVFLYLSLSLICSALNEYYSALLSRRAKHLRDSLYTLFNKDDPKGLAFLLEFYTHPLINGLSPMKTKRVVEPTPGEDLALKLPWYQQLVVVPARVGSDVVGWIRWLVGRALYIAGWIADAIGDPHGVGGGMAGMRKELAVAAKATPTYIPDNAFSGAIFAVLASDSGASRRLEVELNHQLGDIGRVFQSLADPEAAKALATRLDEVSRTVRAEVEKAKGPEEIIKSAQAVADKLLAAIPASDPSYEPALALIQAQVDALTLPPVAVGAIGTPAPVAISPQVDIPAPAPIETQVDAPAAEAPVAVGTTPSPAPAAPVVATPPVAVAAVGTPAPIATSPQVDTIRAKLVDDAKTLPDGASKRELSRLAAQTLRFASLRKAPDASTYLAKLKQNLVDREEARIDTRKRIDAACKAVLAVGPRIPEPAEVRDHIWATLEASLRRLTGAFETLLPGTLRDGLVDAAKAASTGIGPAKVVPPMSIDQAKAAANDAFESIRGKLDALKAEVDQSKAAGWVEKERAALLAAEGDLITIAKLRDAVEALPDSDIRVALLSLMDEVGDDLDHVKRNIQVWYNDSMERVSGWYKRNTQIILSIIAIALASALNADTIAIANKLWDDSTLRANVNALAKSADAENQATTNPPKPATVPNPAGAPPKPAEPPKPAVPNPAGDSTKPAEESEWEIAKNKMLKTDLPLGWGPEDLTKLGFQGDPLATLIERKIPTWDATKAKALITKIVGLVLTAVAVSMGAPFWFDVLNKLVNVRTAGLQPQKTSDKPPPAPSTT